ncbi:MAG: FecR family protein [Betaproteobacteria bacterium]
MDFAVGNVTATGLNGQSRALTRGAQVDQGDTVNTNGGRAQLHFSDGAFVSLQPESQFRIDQYRYDGKQDGNEKGFFSLLKGGLRTITGLVGRTNKANYQVTTSVATIGIRGTEYTIQYGNSVSGSVGEGEINVCNTGGCLSVVNGESYYVQKQDTKPVISSKRTDLPPPPPTSGPPQVVAGETRDKDGNLTTTTEVAPVPPPITGTQTLSAITGSYCSGACVTSSSGAVVAFDANGNLVNYFSSTVTSVQMGGNDGIIAWGTFIDTNSKLTQFVVGAPTVSSELSALNIAQTIGTYTLIGSTPVTNASNQVIGALNSGSLTINFGNSGAATANMNWTLSGANYSTTMTGFTNGGSQFSMAGSSGAFSAAASVGLFGPSASRAGMIYRVTNGSIDGLGVAAFKR